MTQGVHQWDWEEEVRRLGLDYYAQVKAVNYIRRQVAMHRCASCLHQCSSEAHLQLHMTALTHCCLPDDRSSWDQAQYVCV